MKSITHLLAVSDLLTAAESAVNTGRLPARQQMALMEAVQNTRRIFGSAEDAGETGHIRRSA